MLYGFDGVGRKSRNEVSWLWGGWVVEGRTARVGGLARGWFGDLGGVGGGERADGHSVAV